MMKTLSWNCRGIGHPSKVVALKDFIYCEKPGIFLLHETKQSLQDMTKIIEHNKQYNGSISESRGAFEGIATIWNQNIWNYKSEIIN